MTRGTPYTLDEARLVVGQQAMDPYHREVMAFLLAQIDDLSAARPGAAAHEAKAAAFFAGVDSALASVLALPTDERSKVFAHREALRAELVTLLEDAYWRGRKSGATWAYDRVRGVLP